MKDSYTETEPIHKLWAELEKKYGVSNVSNVKASVAKLMRVAQGKFSSVESHIAELKTLKNSINPNSQKYLRRDVITDDLIVFMVLGVLPSEYYGAQISLDENSFSLVEIEAKLIGIFGNKSKKEIVGSRSSQSGARTTEVYYVSNSKRKHDDGKAKQGECFFCFGKMNHLTDGKPHYKNMCPQRKEDFANKAFRSDITKKPNSKKLKKEVKVDVANVFDRDAGYRAPIDAGTHEDVQLSELLPSPTDDVVDRGYIDFGDAMGEALHVDKVDTESIRKRLKDLAADVKRVTGELDAKVCTHYPYLLTDRELASNDWALDSGCGRHLTGVKSYFIRKSNDNSLVFRLGEGSKLMSSHVGSIHL